MKFIIKSILGQINNKLPKDNEELLVKLSGFEDSEIYCNAAKAIEDFAKKNSVNCNIKLANKKYRKFEKNTKNSQYLSFMKNNKDSSRSSKEGILPFLWNNR